MTAPLWALMLLTALGFVILAFGIDRRWCAQRVVGTIVEFVEAGTDSDNGSPRYRAVYEYRDASGQTIRATQQEMIGARPKLLKGQNIKLLVSPRDKTSVSEANFFGIEIVGGCFFFFGLRLIAVTSPDWWPGKISAFVITLLLAYLLWRKYRGRART